MFARNALWRERKLAEDPEYFNKLGAGHNPEYLWIGCSDARVPANQIMGDYAPGSVFVHRNIANQVVNTDMNVMSVIQYAVDHLKVKHIIVCGHYDCGGVRAASTNQNFMSPLENWIRNVRDVRRIHADELNAIEDDEARLRRLVELNVVEQCLSVFKTAVVQRRLVESHDSPDYEYTQPRIHALCFDPADGKLRRLDVDFMKEIKGTKGDIYNLYFPEKKTDDGQAS